MTKFRDLTRFQKVMLLLCVGMTLVFALLTAVVTGRRGILYRDTVLVSRIEDGATLYSGRVDGEKALFTVGADGTITYRWGELTFGPYTLTRDPTAIPADREDWGRIVTGVELRRGEDLLFRGAFYEPDGGRTLLFEDGSTAGFFNSSNSDNVYYDFTQEPNSEEPSAAILVELWAGPVLIHRGHWSFWVMGTFFSALLALWIFYAEKLVRRQLANTVREPEKAEPSEWMLTRQRIGWVLWTILDFVIYSWGLK